MIEKIVLLRGIGLFYEALPSGALGLRRLTTIYAENERGKSTLASILRSLSSGDGNIIVVRKTFGRGQTPEVHFRTRDRSYIFQEGQWNETCPNIVVFDDQFIEKNVCIGSRVEPAHRENLLEFAIGEEGVQLKKDIDEITNQINDINSKLREKERLISQYSSPYNVREFVGLQPEHDVEARLKQVRGRIADASNVELLRRRPVPEAVMLPNFELDDLQALLHSSLENVSDQAEQKVKEHVQHRLDPGGEDWIRQGISYLESNDECPFCGRGDVHTLELIRAYKAYFDASYNELKRRIEDELKKIQEKFGDRCWGEIRERLRLNKAAQDAWRDRPDLTFPPDFNEEDIKSALDGLREATIEAIRLKLYALLSRINVPEALRAVYEKYTQVRLQVNSYNQVIERTRGDIDSLKHSLQTVNLHELEYQLRRLEAENRRLIPDIFQLCTQYQTLQSEKGQLEENKEIRRQDLDQHTENILGRYRENINQLLERFGAGFSIEEMDVKHIRGTPRTEYVLKVLGHSVRVASDAGESSGTSFATVMSSGGKRTLALALFLAKLKADGNLSSYIVVIDDPVSSLDAGRRRETRDALADLTLRCSQVIVLSHDALFLKDLVSRISDIEHESLQIRRQGDYSIIERCDLYRLCRDDYYLVYETLIQYLEQGPTGYESDVADNIREYLEHNLWTRFPIELEGTKNLGEIISRIRQDRERYGSTGRQLDELKKLNEFSRRYHHLASGRRTPPTDAELRPMVELALQIGRG